MAADLAHEEQTGLDVQLCGDAHLSNFGGFASPERDMIFDVNDFDETIPGPFEWDLKRLAASFEIAARSRELRRVGATLDRDAESPAPTARPSGSSPTMRDLDIWYARLDVVTIQARWGGRGDPHDDRGPPAPGDQGPEQGPPGRAGQADPGGRRRSSGS